MTDLRQLVDETPLEELPSLVGRLREAELLAEMRLRGEASGNGSRPEPEDRNLSADEAAQRLGLSRDYLYRNANKLPFTVRIGTRVLFSARGLDRWNRARTGR